eukprot:CFRG0114T1
MVKISSIAFHKQKKGGEKKTSISSAGSGCDGPPPRPAAPASTSAFRDSVESQIKAPSPYRRSIIEDTAEIMNGSQRKNSHIVESVTDTVTDSTVNDTTIDSVVGDVNTLRLEEVVLEKKIDQKSCIVHIGLGNFCRAHFARYMEDYNVQAKEFGMKEWEIRAVDRDTQRTRDLIEYFDISDYTYKLRASGENFDKTVTISSVVELLNMGLEPERAMELLADENTKICSLTVTEKGYSCDLGTGLIIMNPELEHDLTEEGSRKPKSMLGLVVGALKLRMERGIAPITMMSLDNIPGNGVVFKNAVKGFARMTGNLQLEKWIAERVTFPNTMVDRITPNTKFASDTVICEPFRQWVVETLFCNERPKWEVLVKPNLIKILLTDDVVPYEHVKVRLLNATHSMFAYCAYLSGYRQIDKAMSCPRLLYMTKSALRETLTTVHEVEGIDLHEYCELLIQRFKNPNVSDAVSRVCEDGSMKANSFWKPIIMDHIFAQRMFPVLSIGVATWIFYSRGEENNGTLIEIRDPAMGEELKALAKVAHKDKAVAPFLSAVFGEELGETDFFVEQVEYWFTRIAGEGSVNEFLTSMEIELKTVAEAEDIPEDIADIAEPVDAIPRAHIVPFIEGLLIDAAVVTDDHLHSVLPTIT